MIKIVLFLHIFFAEPGVWGFNDTAQLPDDLAELANSTYKSISDKILDKCRNVASESYSPACPLGMSVLCGTAACAMTELELNLWLDRFQDIDDVAEQFHVSGAVTMYWNAPCAGYQLANNIGISLQEDLYWKPHVYHKNSVSDFGMSQNFARRFYANGLEKTSINAVKFFWQLSGVFSSTTSMDHSLFPFDEAYLQIDFWVRDVACAVKFGKVDPVEIEDDFMPHGAAWSFISANSTYGSRVVAKRNRSAASFTLHFKRRPEFFIYNLLIPTATISSLQLAVFAMPTKMGDRPVFSITILLALTFLEGQTLSKIPAKPQRIFLTNYSDLCSLLSWLCTVYCLVTCGMTESPVWRNWLEQTVFQTRLLAKIRRSRFIDAAAFSMALIFIVSLNIAALSVARSANFI